MARCNCSGQVCSCKLAAGDNVAITGAGSAENPYTISAAGGGTGGDTIPPGVFMPYGGSQAPAGWLLCNGQAVNRATFATLFAVVGTRFGAGDGFNTFNVPMMADRVAIGAGGRYPAGSTGGDDRITLTVANLPPHTHGLNNHTHGITHDHPAFATGTGGSHTHKLQMSDQGGSNQSVSQGTSSGHDSAAPVETTGGHAHNINVPSFTGTSAAANPTATTSTGSAAEFSIVPKYVASYWIIKT